MRSLISHAQRDWFIRTAVDAPWAAVPIGTQLVDADPNVSGELYDRAEAARYPHRGRRAMFWVAIRDDVCTNLDSGALPLFRRRLAQSESEQVRRIATLTDVRLLDLLTRAVA